MASPTATWGTVSDTYYRKLTLYSSLWDGDFDLDKYIVAGAPFGGALGTFDQTHSSQNSKDDDTQSDLLSQLYILMIPRYMPYRLALRPNRLLISTTLLGDT